VRSEIIDRSCSANAAKIVGCEPVCLGEIAGDEIDVTVHQCGDEADPARELIELGDDQHGPVLAACGQRSGELRTVVSDTGTDTDPTPRAGLLSTLESPPIVASFSFRGTIDGVEEG
jgi:hypothetical protein